MCEMLEYVWYKPSLSEYQHFFSQFFMVRSLFIFLCCCDWVTGYLLSIPVFCVPAISPLFLSITCLDLCNFPGPPIPSHITFVAPAAPSQLPYQSFSLCLKLKMSSMSSLSKGKLWYWFQYKFHSMSLFQSIHPL